MSGDEAVFRRDRAYINKLNAALVGVLKQEWPARWPSFIPDLVAAAKSSETLCENCMHILKVRARRFRSLAPLLFRCLCSNSHLSNLLPSCCPRRCSTSPAAS